MLARGALLGAAVGGTAGACGALVGRSGVGIAAGRSGVNSVGPVVLGAAVGSGAAGAASAGRGGNV